MHAGQRERADSPRRGSDRFATVLAHGVAAAPQRAYDRVLACIRLLRRSPWFVAMTLAALWVFGAVELPLLLGADPAWSARIHPVAWLLHLHAACGVAALISGSLQFVTAIRRSYPRLHRVLGMCYTISIAIASPAAVVVAVCLCEPALALAASVQACLWLVATIAGVRAVCCGDMPRHGWWMTRSFALTYTFVVGRLVTDVFHLRLPVAIGGDAALTWLLTLASLVVADLCYAQIQPGRSFAPSRPRRMSALPV